MLNTNRMSLSVGKVNIILGAWGLAMLIGGVASQSFGLSADTTLLVWGALTAIGVAAQIASFVRGLEMNITAWLIVIVAGWAFTLYVTKMSGGDLYPDLAGVWLILLGLGYVATAFQVDKRFFAFAALHILVGLLMELSARQIVSIGVLDQYSSLIFGLVAGIPLIIAALPVWYTPANRA